MSRFSKDVSLAGFQAEVIEKSRQALVLVDFWADWCGPCRTLKPLLEKLVDSYDGRVLLAKVNADLEPDLAAHYRVRGIPNVKAFRDGRMVDEFSGVLPEQALREFVERWLPSPMQAVVERAAEAREAGDEETAERLLREALAAEPDLESAALQLAELLLDTARGEQAEALLRPLQYRAKNEDKLAELLARLSIGGGEAGEDRAALQARIAADPDDLKARLALGRLLATNEEWAPALDALLEIVRRDRGFQDDIGRRLMVDVFNLMPAGHPALRAYRAQLAQAINR